MLLCFIFILIPKIYLAQSKNNQSPKKKPGKSVFFKSCNDTKIAKKNAKIYKIEDVIENNDDIFEPGFIRFSYAAADVNSENTKQLILNVTQILLNENFQLAKMEGQAWYSISKKKLTDNNYPNSRIGITIIFKKSLYGVPFRLNPIKIIKKDFESTYANDLSNKLKNFLGNQKIPGIYELELGFKPNFNFSLTPQGFFGFNGIPYQPVNESGQPIGDFGRPIASAAKYNIISLEEVNEAETTIAEAGPTSVGFNILGVIAGVASISIPITNPYQLFTLNGFDSLNQKESSEFRNIRFWNLGAEKDFNFLTKVLDNCYGSKVNDPVTGKLIKNKYDKMKDFSDAAKFDVEVNMNTNKNKGTLNYPMKLRDFSGFGYIAAFKAGPFLIQQINIWLEGDKNKKFELFSVKADIATNTENLVDTLTLGMSFKVGYFQPVGF